MAILPRIQSFLPSDHILEIAPGFGRCTQFLKESCKKLTVVDISEKCIQACQTRFQDSDNIEYRINDGKSLTMIPDNSIDFIFSWDSLVHADNTVFQSYIKQFPRIMKPGGFGFIHHSNLAEYIDKNTGKLIYEDIHSRDVTMDSSLFLKYCNESKLNCILQEKINWRCNFLNDCLSIITYKNNNICNTNKNLIANYNFMEEAMIAKSLSNRYNFLNEIKNKSKKNSNFSIRTIKKRFMGFFQQIDKWK